MNGVVEDIQIDVLVHALADCSFHSTLSLLALYAIRPADPAAFLVQLRFSFASKYFFLVLLSLFCCIQSAFFFALEYELSLFVSVWDSVCRFTRSLRDLTGPSSSTRVRPE